MSADTPETLSTNTEEARRQKRDRMIAQGIDPYPLRFDRTITQAELAEKYAHLEAGERSGDVVSVAGRVYSSRNSGMFMDLRDASGKVQVFCHKDETPAEAMDFLPMIDVGDIIGVTGEVRRTPRGEITVNARTVTMLCKTLRPMPEKHHGIRDVETRHRKRYLDVMVNPESKERLIARSRILAKIRDFMGRDGFLEVETPMLHPIYGGASADPFVTHHNALDQDMFLRIAPELYLKRVLVSGLTDKVFEINRNFRNEGLSTRHNPEFTMLEAYWAYASFTDAMDLVERMFAELSELVNGGPTATMGEHVIDFGAPFRRLPMPQAVKDATGIDFLAIEDDATARAKTKALGYEVEDDWTWGECLAFVFEEAVEHTLIQPTHVTDFPVDISPFAKVMEGEPRLTERFETYVNAWEVCNAFSELNDPVAQRERMTDQWQQAQARGETMKELDLDFLEAIDHGMPTAAGIGIGIDRLAMVLTGTTSIRDILLFPTLRKTEARGED
ncbi:lysine--tRNA ligase [Roseivivax isoporae]|uniref:Lysine--tRNA ligase n=1 Tax=Roseivivax isoporae LMG 25204 TaxID=1449351 RepID=X7F9B7_9RHOB|nr:lysine--tRNA ligase [Roseivivax isoporae]ETX29318.1 lysyl-tRNA synthetase [Roseivivax isoporae LMG 25204]